MIGKVLLDILKQKKNLAVLEFLLNSFLTQMELAVLK